MGGLPSIYMQKYVSEVTVICLDEWFLIIQISTIKFIETVGIHHYPWY